MRDETSNAPATFPLQLQLWLSPSFPVGSFAYSHALEWAVGSGHVHDRETAEAWLLDLLRHGSARNDVILLAQAWRAARAGDDERLAEVNALALALAGSRERFLETSLQGAAFLSMVRTAWGHVLPPTLNASIDAEIAYPVAVGYATGASGIEVGAAAQAYLAAFSSNLVAALVRLAAIGQTDGQRVLAALSSEITATSGMSAASTLDDIGSAAFVSDIGSLAHETQETRMFRS